MDNSVNEAGPERSFGRVAHIDGPTVEGRWSFIGNRHGRDARECSACNAIEIWHWNTWCPDGKRCTCDA